MHSDTSHRTDQELARFAANGDRAAFEAIVQRYTRPLAEFAANKTRTVQDAEDIVQETFLRALVHVESFDPQYTLKNWLFTIAYRLIVSGYRKKMPHLMDEQTLYSCIDTKGEPALPMDWLWETAARMGQEFHSVLWLRYKEQMDIPDIARVMNKNKLSVRVLLHRARRRLAERLAETVPDEDIQYWIQSGPCTVKGKHA